MDKKDTDTIKNNVDYGWRFQGRPILCHEDRSIVVDESIYNMQMALSQMSREFYYLERCMQCGICTEACPNTHLNMADAFSPREFIQKLRLGLLDLSGDDLWFCTNCGACESVCPFDIHFIEVMTSLRNLVMEQGAGYLPPTLKNALSSMSSYHNPWMEDPENRSSCENTVSRQKKRSRDTIFVFIGCFPSYDMNGKRIAQSAARILSHAGIDFETLGNREVCCGDSAFRSGDYEGFNKLKDINMNNIEKQGIRTIYTLSPHCYDIMNKKYYPEGEYSVKPLLLYIYEMLQTKQLEFRKSIHKRMTFHDPCFFCKHNNIIDEPRAILKSLPGAELVEMEHFGQKSICCGGGGGGAFLDRGKGERLAEIRLNEALRVKADVLVTACPICLAMIADSAESDDTCKSLEIKDIFELIAEAL